ncbi:Hypothetical protein PMT_2458 [Prochlorococcus marinus str. MIT 9313]|uniref:Uncharacterized protein n=1 Tax=Prochlorococcus marinus (strain MIT 9313) TaxID=74547 RepID=B9ERA9_PROMM|nr:Hypothetical protein PMT_2458 [Prochlorococcus marinus str. MIT 9313]
MICPALWWRKSYSQSKRQCPSAVGETRMSLELLNHIAKAIHLNPKTVVVLFLEK